MNTPPLCGVFVFKRLNKRMKSFQQYLIESTEPIGWIDIPAMFGELRLAGIHAGNRDALDPFRASRSMIGIRSALQRIETVLHHHGLLLGDIQPVTRDGPQIEIQCALYQTLDETRRVGLLRVIGEINPIDKGTMSFRTQFNIPSVVSQSPDYLF